MKEQVLSQLRRERPAASVDAEKVLKATQSLSQLKEKAIDEAVTYSIIETEVTKIGKKVSAAETKEVASQLGIAETLKTKKAALEAIQRMITERKESYQRTQFGNSSSVRDLSETPTEISSNEQTHS